MTVRAVAHIAFPFATQRLRWALQRRRLDRLRTRAEFERFVQRERPEVFLDYRARAGDISTQFDRTAAALGLELAGRRVLDIGPGYGEVIDAALGAGAAAIDFIELDPVFFTWNRLKGATGHGFNFVTSLDRHLHGSRFDVVWARGCHVADQLAAAPRLLERWLHAVDGLSGDDARVVVIPFFESHWVGEHNRLEPLLNVDANPFTDTMRAAGFKLLDSPSDLLGAAAYPVVFDRR